MIHLTNGPAANETLMLKRAPLFLRITIEDVGQVDALDQLADLAKKNEQIHVYRRTTTRRAVHINCGKRGPTGYYAAAHYELHHRQPTDSIARSTDKWQEWCIYEAAELNATQRKPTAEPAATSEQIAHALLRKRSTHSREAPDLGHQVDENAPPVLRRDNDI